MYYHIVDTPLGALFLAATDRGLMRVAFEVEGFDSVRESLTEQVGVEVHARAKPLGKVIEQLNEYFSGYRQRFELNLDHRLSSGFRRDVQVYLRGIGYGYTQSYKEVADGVGNPKAVRAVGTACATNPMPVIVPCHRVVRSDGKLGGYRGGLELKQVLLNLERKGE